METFYRVLFFLLSMLLLSLICFISYKTGKKSGIKKSLYKISYMFICVIFAFIIAPYLNEYLLNYNLYDIKWHITFNGMTFYKIIDFVEEVIVHNKVLNDIYNFVPSLKNLLMDFPQILTIPFVYLITFISLAILLFPLYLFLSKKRKKQYLYDKEKSGKEVKLDIWAGVINSVLTVFLISIILTPFNGLSRIYKDSKKELIDKSSNLCLETKYLEKYAYACNSIEAYNSSVFSLIGYSPINNYIYSSLTRIHYNNQETNLSNEAVNIARAGIVLNKIGLLEAVNVEDFDDVGKLNFKNLTEEDIDVVVYAVEKSIYTRDVIIELYDWSKKYMDWLLQDIVHEEFNATYEYEDMVNELKIILRGINYLLNNERVLNNVDAVYQIVDNYLHKPKPNITINTKLRLFFDIVYAIDVDLLIDLYGYLKDSKIYRDVVPQIIDHALQAEKIIVNTRANPDELDQAVIYALNIVKIIQNHKYVYDVLHLLSDLTTKEWHYLAEVFEYFYASETLNHLLPDLARFGVMDAQIELDLPYDIFYKIEEWDRELELLGVVMQIIYTYESKGKIDYSKIWYGLTHYSDTELFEVAFKYVIKMLPDILTIWLAGKDFDYLVGEYVA